MKQTSKAGNSRNEAMRLTMVDIAERELKYPYQKRINTKSS